MSAKLAPKVRPPGMSTLGGRMRLARRAADLSVRDLAARAGRTVTPHTVKQWESGESLPNSSDLVRIGKVLNVSLDFLLGKQLKALEFGQ